MSGSPVGNTLTFVIQFIFGIYILIVMLRFLLQWVRADFYNPISQLIVRATQPVLKPMRRMVPSVGGLDTSSLLLMLGLQMLELWLVGAVVGMGRGLVALLVLAIAHLLELLAYVFMVSIIVLAVLSWIQPRTYNPAIGLLNSLASPVLRPLRQLVPITGGIDLTPLVALLLLGIALRLIVWPLAGLVGG